MPVRDIPRCAEFIIRTLSERGQMIVTAESCTGGLIAAALTDIPGSSVAVHGGFVTYANRAKQEMIGVPASLIEKYGAVSEPVAIAMAEGALKTSRTDIAIAVTGVAGPAGGTASKPVGLVHFACATARRTQAHIERFGDIGRQQVRKASVLAALELVIESLENASN
jgi:nicotinamide-nucleotide amidase